MDRLPRKGCSRWKEKIEKHEVTQPQACHCLKGETDATRSTSYSGGSNKPETSSEISNVADAKVNTEICNRRVAITRKKKGRTKGTRRTDVDNLLGHECLAIYHRNRGHLKNNQNSSIAEKNYISQERASCSCGPEDNCSMLSIGSDEMVQKSTPELPVEDMENAQRKRESIFTDFMTVSLAQLHHREKECTMQMLEKCVSESAGNCNSHQDHHSQDNKVATFEKEVQSSNLVVPPKKENHVPRQEVNFPCGIKDEDNIIFANHLVNTSQPSNGGGETKRSSTCRSKSSEDTQTHDNFAETFEQDSCVVQQSLLVGYLKNLSHDMTREQMIAMNRRLLSPEKSIIRREKKLLVLDLNGLLADVLYVSRCSDKVYSSDKVYKRIKGKSVFKRPFCDEFLNFCFEAFHVGLWSSRQKKNIDPMVDYLVGERKHELLFCWDLSKCTQTGFKTLENFHKPLVLKELKRLWNKEEMCLPWDKGAYLPWNTLLLDDSPYKALCNPPCTAVFPPPYSYLDENDNSLGPGGDIRVYLEGLVMANDVRYYVQQNPFGQNPITEMHGSWLFYQRVIETVNHSLHPRFSMW